jgi:hypothetical protein
MSERRQGMLRRDLNDLVRDESGHLSPSKVGTLMGQWLSVKLILENGKEIISNWDSLTVLFSVLIAPELFKKLMNMKYSGTTTTTDSSTQTTTRQAQVRPGEAAG